MPEANVAEPPLVLRLFGPFDARIHGRPLPRLRTRKGQLLLALLVLRQGRAVERAFLAGLLWPESTEVQALANLRLSLTDLRRALGLEAARLSAPSAHTLAFDLQGATLDLAMFDRDIASGDATRLQKAVELYRGPLLEGCAEGWAAPEREAREQSYLNALERLAAHAREQRDPAAEADFLRRCLATDPYRESALCALMEACVAKGDPIAAQRAYREFRMRLDREMNAQPDPQTTALYRRLMAPLSGPAPLAAPRSPQGPLPPALSSLPNPLTPLIGRKKEVEEVCARLRASRLVTLKGPGGSGKTRLAIAVGQYLQEPFTQRIWFVSLAELPDADRLPATLRDTLGLPPDQDNPWAKIVKRLSERPSLLILDNYEHLIVAGARFVQELLASAPSLICLVTSRHSLHLSGEIEYEVQPLGLPDKQEPLSRLRDFAGVQLFVERAAARRAGFHLTRTNSEAIVALCTQLEGIPLAIELVAAWADVLTPAQMRARLEAGFAFPGGRYADIPERHQSLQRAFNGSYALLDEAERQMLRRLCVFTGGWTLEAAEAICSEERLSNGIERINSIPAPPILILLKQLVEKSLVQLQQDPRNAEAPPRYRLLEMTRQYAAERLSPAEREVVERRHAEYFFAQALAEEAESNANETSYAHRRKMEPDKENYDAALQRWRAADSDKAMEMMVALDTCGIWVPKSGEREDWIRRLETQPLPAPSTLQAKLYLQVGLWATHRGLSVRTLLIEQAYTLAQGCGESACMAYALFYLGEWDYTSGRPGRARERLEASLGYALRIGHQPIAATAQKILIYLACAEHDYERARQMGEAQLRSGRERNHWLTMTRALEALGHMAAEQQDYALARHYWEQAMTAYPESNPVPRCNTLRVLGRTAARQGDYAAASDFYCEAAAISREAGDEGHEADAYHGLAEIAHRQGEDDEAVAWETRALHLFDRIGVVWTAISLRALARLAHRQPERAALLWSAYEHRMAETGTSLTPTDQEELEVAYASLRTSLTAEAVAALRKRGATMTLDDIIHSAQEQDEVRTPCR